MEIEPVKSYSRDARKYRPDNINGFDYGIEWCRYLLRFLGGWPDPYSEDNWLTSVHCLSIVSTMLIFTTICQAVQMMRTLNNLNRLIEISVNCCIPVTIAMVKLISVWYHRNSLRRLVLQVIEDWRTQHGEEELKIMWRSARISRLFAIGCFLLNKVTLTAQSFTNFNPIIVAARTKSTKPWPLYFNGSFPYNTQAHPNFELTILGQWLSNTFAALSFESTDSFFVFLIFHLISQLSILKMRIYELPNQRNQQAFLNKYAEIHAIHNRLWRYLQVIENSFNIMFFIQMIPCIFVLCTQGYMLITITDADSIALIDLIFMVQFLMLFVTTIFTYCFVAECLRQESFEISYAIYDSDWTSLQPAQAKILIPMIMRAQHPFEITAGKFASLSLKLFGRILKSSAGYLSMLLAVKDRIAAENVT